MKFAKLPRAIHGEVRSLAIDRTGRFMATGGLDGRVSVWDYPSILALVREEITDGTAFQRVKPTTEIECHLTGLSEGIIDSDLEVAAIPAVNCVRFSPSSLALVSCDDLGRVFITINDISTLVFRTEERIGDLSWSADGRMLAMACLTECVLFDTILKTNQTISTTILVKGVAFDPTNNYLMVLGEDRTVQIYQYSYTPPATSCSIHLIHKVTNLINKQTLGALYKRASWSPEGNFLAMPNATKNNVSLISVISRKNWLHLFSLVGHGHTCEVVAFSPKTGLGEGNQLCSFLASAGSDNSVALWSTLVDQPLFVARGVSSKAVVDVAWAKDGRSFVTGALDGSVCFFSFDDTELGDFLADDDIALRRAHNSNPPEFVPTPVVSKEPLVEAPAVTVPDARTSEEAESEAEMEVIGPSTWEATEGVDPPSTQDAAGRDASPSEPKSLTPVPPTEKPPSTKPAPNGREVQKETTLNGKRRIQPVLVKGTNAISVPSAPPRSPEPFTMEFDAPSYAVSSSVHSRLKQVGLEEQKKRWRVTPMEFVGSVAHNPQIAFSNTRIATPKVRLHFVLKAPINEDLQLEIQNGSGTEQRPSRISLMKATPGNALKPHQQIFVDFIPRLVHLSTGGEGLFWAVATVEGCIHVYSDGGRRLLAPLVLGTPLSFLESRGDYLMAVTCVGQCYVWDMRSQRAVFEPASVYPILEPTSRLGDDGLSRTENITLCSVTAAGVPVVTLSNGNGYLYNVSMGTWCTVSDSWWAFGSQYWDAQRDAQPAGLIALLEQKTNEEITRKGRGKVLQKIAKVMLMKEGFENLENAISLAHLENKIMVSKLLGEHADFRSLLMVYTQRVSELGFKTRLVEICLSLFEETAGEEEKVCGFTKRSLLTDIILGCAPYRDVQRILGSFAEALGLTDTFAGNKIEL